MKSYEEIIIKLSRSQIKEGIIFEPEINFNEWGELLETLVDNRLLVTLFRYIKGNIPISWIKIYEQRYDERIYILESKIMEFTNIYSNILNIDKTVTLSKGFILSEYLYGEDKKRYFGDIDILVSQNKLKSVLKYLQSQGYVSSNNEGSIDMPYNEMFWEVGMRKKLSNDVNSFIEVKIGYSGFNGQQSTYFRENTIPHIFRNMQFRVPNVLSTFVLLVASAYKNSESIFKYSSSTVKLREYVDLASFIYKHSNLMPSVLLTLEKLAYVNQTKTVFKHLLDLYPFLSEFNIVMEVNEMTSNNDVGYSLYYPIKFDDLSIRDRIFRKDYARKYFFSKLKTLWFGCKKHNILEPLIFNFPLSKTNCNMKLSIFFNRKKGISAKASLPLHAYKMYTNGLLINIQIFSEKDFHQDFLNRDATLNLSWLLPPSKLRRFFEEDTDSIDGQVFFKKDIDDNKLLNYLSTENFCLFPSINVGLQNGKYVSITNYHIENFPVCVSRI